MNRKIEDCDSTADRAQAELCKLVGLDYLVSWEELIGRVRLLIEVENPDGPTKIK